MDGKLLPNEQFYIMAIFHSVYDYVLTSDISFFLNDKRHKSFDGVYELLFVNEIVRLWVKEKI